MKTRAITLIAVITALFFTGCSQKSDQPTLEENPSASATPKIFYPPLPSIPAEVKIVENPQDSEYGILTLSKPVKCSDPGFVQETLKGEDKTAPGVETRIPYATGLMTYVHILPGTGPYQSLGKGKFAHCYAHTPKGAILAAANAYTFFEATNSEAGANWAEWTLSDFPRKPEFVESMRKNAKPHSRPNFLIHAVGHKFTFYSASEATVSILYTSPAFGDGDFLEATFSFKWENNDWRLIFDLQSYQKFINQYSPKAAHSSKGYVLWHE